MMGAGIRPMQVEREEDVVQLFPCDRRWFRFLLPAVLLATGAGLISSGLDTRTLQRWIDPSGPWSALVFVVLGVGLMSVMVPKTIVSITAGAMFGTMIGSGVMLITAVAAATLNYSIGRWWLFDSIDRMLTASTSSDAAAHRTRWWRAVRDMAAEAGFGFHLLVRMSPVPTTLISYTMGASGSRLLPFVTAAAVAVVPQMLWVHGGTAAMMIDGPPNDSTRWLGIVASIAAALMISVIVPQRVLRRLETIPPQS